MKRVFPTLIVSFFFWGQIGFSGHVHEHADDVEHDVCEFCILAVHEDLDEGISDSTDSLDPSDDGESLGLLQSQIDQTLAVYSTVILRCRSNLTREFDRSYSFAARGPPREHSDCRSAN